MTADWLARRAAPGGPPPGLPPAEGVPQWRRDVIDGVARRFAYVVVPALFLGVVARVLSADWDIAIVAAITMVASAATLLRAASPQVRVALVVGVFVFANAALVFLAREIPFHGILMPMGAAFAALIGGLRIGLGTLAALSMPWLIPIALALAGRPAPVDLPQPVHALRLWLLYTGLAAGVVAAVHHVVRSLQASLAEGDELRDRLDIEGRAAHALAGRVTEAEERERERLAHELHDDFGQRLTALLMKLQMARAMPERMPGAIEESATMVEGLLRDVRTVSRGLRPPLLDEVGLLPALRALCELHSGAPEIALAIEVPDAVARLPHSMELAAYRVFQEAIANVVHHAQATKATLRVAHVDDHLVIVLSDDGCGFDTRAAGRAAAAGQHLGLVGMRERAAFIGAELQVRSAPRHGTTVRLRIPWARTLHHQDAMATL
jgi:signal transduction histidine kinase